MGLDRQKRMTALRLAAALGYLSVSNMDCVSYRLVQGARCVDLCGSIIGRESYYGAVRKLEETVFSGTADLGAAILSDPNAGFDDGMSYIISDFLTDSDWKSAVDHLIGRKREVALIQVLTPQELQPEAGGARSFSDAETGARIRVDVNRDALRAYEQAVAFFLNDIRQFCVSRGVPFMTVRSDERVEEVLITRGCVEELIQ